MGKIVGLLGDPGAGKDTAANVLVGLGWKRIAFGDVVYKEVAQAFGVTVELLQRRDTKESPLKELALTNCTNREFVEIVMVGPEVSRAMDYMGYVVMLGIFAMLGVTFMGMVHYLPLAAGLLLVAAMVYVGARSRSYKRPRSPRELLQNWAEEFRRQRYGEDYLVRRVAEAVLAEPDINWVASDLRRPDEADLLKSMGGILNRVIRPNYQSKLGDKEKRHYTESALKDYPVDGELVNVEDQPEVLREAVRQRFASPQDLPLAA